MDKTYSPKWKSSKSPRKQRKYRMNAPLHIKSRFLNVHLAKELRQKYGKRAIRVRKGDKVKVIVGQFRGKIGKVAVVNSKRGKVQVEGIDMIKKDGSKMAYMLQPSNLMIMEMNTDDKMRMKPLEAKK